MNTESDLELGRFGDFLLKSRIVAERHARYYVAWVRKFLAQVPERAGVTLEDRIMIFLDNLRHQVQDWQLDQAEKAVRLYFSNYLNGARAEPAVTSVTPDPAGRVQARGGRGRGAVVDPAAALLVQDRTDLSGLDGPLLPLPRQP